MKKILSAMLIASMAISAVPISGYAEETNQVKNVIMMIADGHSVGGTTLARWYDGGKPLALDEMACGLVRTFCADSAITDSAPAATAYATGHKSHAAFIGVLPDANTMPGLDPIAPGDERKPVANIIEAARLKGMSTGVVATIEAQHATPAAFTAHSINRKNFNVIAEQQVYQGVDVLLAGGMYALEKSGRGDGEDLVSEIKNRGYDFVTTPDEMKKSTSDKLWGVFARADLSYDIDRDPKEQPSLAEMTDKAISVLNKNPEGFFLMVEASKVDQGAHPNDPVAVVSDVLAYDKAVKTALDFAKKDGNTVVIAVTDHGNGGISIGDESTTPNYMYQHIDTFLTALKKASKTGEGIGKILLDCDKSQIPEIVEKYYGIDDLTDEELAILEKDVESKRGAGMIYSLGKMISKRAHIGWTTGGHTGEDVPLYLYAPEGVEKLGGVIDNTDISKYMTRLLGLDLDATTEKLFVPVRKAFEEKGAEVVWDVSDAKNPVVVVKKGETEIKLPVDKSIAIVNGESVQLDGLTVYNGILTYVPQSAIDLLK